MTDNPWIWDVQCFDADTNVLIHRALCIDWSDLDHEMQYVRCQMSLARRFRWVLEEVRTA